MILQKINQTINFLRENYKLLFATIFFFIFSFVLFLSLVSYNPIDLIEKGGKLNIFGAFGAKMAYHFVQYFGFASYFIVFIFLRFAFIFALNGFPARYKIRTFSLILSLILLCFLLGSVKKYEFTFYHLIGGYLGFLLSEVLQRYSYFSLILVVSFAVFLALTTFALNLHEIKLVRFFLSKIRFKIALPLTFKRKQKIAQKQEFVSQKKPSRMEAQAPVLMAQKVHSIIKYIPPSISLLALNSGENQKKNAKNLTLTKNIEKELSKVLLDFGIEAIIKGSRVGPVITMYEVEPKAGIRASRVVGLAEDISRSLKAKSARISLIPSSSSLAVEIPNIERETVFLREILDGIEYKETDFHIPIALGKSIAGDNIVVDLTTMPHLLVAGTTGSGKSVGVNAMILSILYKLSPNECQFVMIDPKMLELSVYNDIPHLITPVITESEKAVMALKWLTIEMEKRYRKMSDLSVRNIFNYNEEIAKLDAGGGNEKQLKKMPFIVVVIDEMADLMITAGKVIEGYIQRLAQMARAAGIHVIMATQRPSVDVITGVIKANFPTRISYQVSSKIDSRTILGAGGAEALLGKGDMLYMQAGAKTYRIHAPFVSDGEVNNIVSTMKKMYGNSYSVKVDIFEEILEEGSSGGSLNEVSGSKEGLNEGDLYTEALEIVISENKPSISYLQRRLKIGYNKAANLIERMEKEGILSPPEPATGKRIILKK